MELTIAEKQGQLFADSREVAQMVGKPHNKLLRDIRTYIDHFNQSKIGPVGYFVEATYRDEKGEERPRYDITRKGCDLIAHKLTGVKGTVFSVSYINRFYEMERAIMERRTPEWEQARSEGKKARRMETDAIKEFVAYAKAQGSLSADKYYIHFSRLADKAVGIADRDTASAMQLLDLRVAEKMIERAVIAEIAAGEEYHRAFRNVRDRVQQVSILAFAPVIALAG